MAVYDVINRLGAEVVRGRARVFRSPGNYVVIAEIRDGQMELTAEGMALAEDAVIPAPAKPRKPRVARAVQTLDGVAEAELLPAPDELAADSEE